MNLAQKSLVALGATGALVLSACSPTSDDAVDSDTLQVSTAFYALTFVTESVAGDRAEVTQLAPEGVSPHDLELSPSTVLDLADADLAIYLGEFQAAVDDAVSESGVHSLDVAEAADLHEYESDSHAHDEDEHADEDEHDHGDLDFHFWLDTDRMAAVADAVAAELSAIDPEGTETYAANAAAFAAEMDDLDESYSTGLASCERDTIVVTHAAYGYLAEKYGLTQVSMSGIDPEAEPSPAVLLEIQQIVAETGATTVFTEDEVTTSVSQALADDTGTDVAVLATGGAVESGDDYISLMTRNLDALTMALGCE